MGERFSEERLSQVLADCLDALNGSDSDLEALANRYPDMQQELRPLLEVARSLRQRRAQTEPSPQFLNWLKEQLSVASGKAQGP